MSFTDAVSRVSQIQAQIASLQTAFAAPVATTGSAPAGTAPAGTAPAGTAAPAAASAAGNSPGSDFATVLAQAQDAGSAQGLATNGVSPTGLPSIGAALPASAESMLTSSQQQFASRLASDTGLDPGVISAWLLAEESGGAAQSRQTQGNNDWLNIGYTDAGTYGSGDSIWSDPIAAADATAGWLKGQNTIPGYGTASAGIQGVLATVGQPPAAQIAALQQSGWASSGYPSLPTLYQQLAA